MATQTIRESKTTHGALQEITPKNITAICTTFYREYRHVKAGINASII
jgi:hypothetical protein